MNINSKRLESESFDEYKARRKVANKAVSRYLKGRAVKYTEKEIKAMEF